MNRHAIFDNQLRYAVHVIDSYLGQIPLHAWLKDFFRAHKQMGSRDRKVIGSMVYSFYRLGHALRDLPARERILTGLFLCQPPAPGGPGDVRDPGAPADNTREILTCFKPEWEPHGALPIEEKITFCRDEGLHLCAADIFPWKEELSEGIDHTALCLSFLRQPDLFLRIRPGHEKTVLEKTAEQYPGARFIPPSTLRLPNGFSVEGLFTPDKEVVIQDHSSQRIAEFFPSFGMSGSAGSVDPAGSVGSARSDGSVRSVGSAGSTGSEGSLRIWDACAASGGKSILAHDLYPRAELTVSDIRESILRNLRARFRSAGIVNYHAFAADLTATQKKQGPGAATDRSFDLIIADVPCTGSGTWSRTPEELYFFTAEKIGIYRDRQEKILSNLPARLARDGRLLYCTCSVFKRENEDITGWITRSFGAKIEEQASIKGYGEGADSMFVSRLGGFNCG